MVKEGLATRIRALLAAGVSIKDPTSLVGEHTTVLRSVNTGKTLSTSCRCQGLKIEFRAS